MASSIDDIRRRLGVRSPSLHPVGTQPPRVRAAVAMIARGGIEDVELLFIRRSHKDDDPWSGDIAFPGGRIDGLGEAARAAAERETLEEVGIDLGTTECLGQLDDVVGGAGEVVVSGFVYSLTAPVELRPNHEVAAAGWVELRRLCEPARQGERVYRYQGRDVSLPAVRIFDDDSPSLWGLTYQFCERFLHLIGRPIPATPLRRPE